MKIRPIVLCGGAGTRLWQDQKNNQAKQFIDFGGWTLISKTLERIKNPIFDYPIISTNQKYLKDVRNGDKRIILLNGYAVGAINRVPKLGESRSNMHVGGKPEKTELTDRDKFICKEISHSLIKKGLYFVGIDIIGGYITEINVTSPTGIREIKNLDSIAIEEMFWDFIEKKLKL